jgi:hypothetical protein
MPTTGQNPRRRYDGITAGLSRHGGQRRAIHGLFYSIYIAPKRPHPSEPQPCKELGQIAWQKYFSPWVLQCPAQWCILQANGADGQTPTKGHKVKLKKNRKKFKKGVDNP